jgi:hypothetical protein
MCSSATGAAILRRAPRSVMAKMAFQPAVSCPNSRATVDGRESQEAGGTATLEADR